MAIRAISQAIANIIKNKQHQESQGYWRAISLPFIGFCAGMLMIGLAAGLVSGLAIAKLFLPTPNLNAQSARDLAWVASDNGKLAMNLVDWNRDILKTCLQDQQNLKEAAVPNSNGNTKYKYINSIVHIRGFELFTSEGLTCF